MPYLHFHHYFYLKYNCYLFLYQTLEQIVFIFAKIEISSKKMFKADKSIFKLHRYLDLVEEEREIAGDGTVKTSLQVGGPVLQTGDNIQLNVLLCEAQACFKARPFDVFLFIFFTK